MGTMQINSFLQGGATVAPSSNRVLVTTTVPEQKTAWTKARKDVLKLASETGYVPLALPGNASPLAWWRFLRALSARLAPGGHVLIEYPIDQRKRLLPLWQFCRWRGVRLDALIHDLDSLRFDTPRQREIAILRMFDGLISHNAAMTSWLREGGIRGQVVDLGLFDYCAPQAHAWHEEGISTPLKVVCAGNLSYPKARYLYDPRLGQLEGVELSLFGVFFEPDRMPDSPVQYKNAFDPDTPRLDGPYHFGLVWDGSGVDRCEGRYGHYMRYNNPHKLSLYAALGLPVVVWEEAAIARFVLDRGIGVAIADLRELGSLPSRVNSEAYRRMAANMRTVGQAALEGQFLRRALGELQAA
jgi:hypothetical protein